jgi:hypothetical protein
MPRRPLKLYVITWQISSMAARDDRLRLLMAERLSDPEFLHHIATPAMPSPSGDPALYRLAAIVDREAIPCLTAKQSRIFRCVLRGMTQEEIGRACGVNQSSVSLAIHGGLVYRGPYAGRRYGGLFWKLAGRTVRSAEARDILEQLAERDIDALVSVRRGKSPWTRRWLRLADPHRLPRRG